eukprot:361875-Chlamydomonas_euryale.AAC.3
MDAMLARTSGYCNKHVTCPVPCLDPNPTPLPCSLRQRAGLWNGAGRACQRYLDGWHLISPPCPRPFS